MAAITFYQQPTATTIQASDNPIIFVWSGANYLQPNFCFIVQTVIDGVTLSTDMVFPERGARAHFDICKTTLAAFKAAVRSSGLYTLQNFSTAKIKVAERYGSTPVTYGFSDSQEFRIMKACCDDEVFEANWITVNYPASSKWLTDVPDNIYLTSRDCPAWFSILNSDNHTTVGLTFTEANGTVTIHSCAADSAADRVNFCISQTSLGAVLSAHPTVVWANIVMIEVQMNAADSIYVKFVDDDCELNQQISWLNKLGTYDQMLFSHNREVQHSIQSQEYKKQFGQWSDNGQSFVHDPLTSGDTPYLKVIEPTGSLYTGWVSQTYQNWLNTIARSIDTLLHVGSSTERITVTDTKTDELQTKYEEIMNFQVNYKKTNFKSINQ